MTTTIDVTCQTCGRPEVRTVVWKIAEGGRGIPVKGWCSRCMVPADDIPPRGTMKSTKRVKCWSCEGNIFAGQLVVMTKDEDREWFRHPGCSDD